MASSSGQEKPKLMVENISCIIPETETLGGLFVGNTYGAENAEILKQYGIRAVLTTSIQTPITYNPVNIPFHLKIQAHDKNDYQIVEHLNQCIEFIHKFRQLTNVYVHCYAGVSRSVTIVVAYLMKFWKWNSKAALAFVQSKRIVAKPNDGFMEQLKKYQQILFPQNRPVTSYILNPNTNINQHNYQNNLYSQGQPQKIQVKKQLHFVNPMNLTKKHSQTPIPKILTKQSLQKKQDTNSTLHFNQKNYSNSTNRLNLKLVSTNIQNTNNYLVNNLQNISQGYSLNSKPGKVLIRPKDLPGYKN